MLQKFDDLKGQIITNIERNSAGDDELIFTLLNNEKYRMFHSQDCCEDVSIDDICGDLTDLLNTPILMAEEISYSDETPKGLKLHEYADSSDSYTWTFYKLGTIKGAVTIRWYGGSNGYYSESVDFEKI